MIQTREKERFRLHDCMAKHNTESVNTIQIKAKWVTGLW